MMGDNVITLNSRKQTAHEDKYCRKACVYLDVWDKHGESLRRFVSVCYYREWRRRTHNYFDAIAAIALYQVVHSKSS